MVTRVFMYLHTLPKPQQSDRFFVAIAHTCLFSCLLVICCSTSQLLSTISTIHVSLNRLSIMSTDKIKTTTITIRIIRSLQHRNIRPLIIREIDLNTTTLRDLRNLIEDRMKSPGSGFPPPFTRDLAYYDSFKLETNPLANYTKSANALINLTTRVIDFTPTSSECLSSLSSLGLTHECEVSCFNSHDYEEYMKNQET